MINMEPVEYSIESMRTLSGEATDAGGATLAMGEGGPPDERPVAEDPEAVVRVAQDDAVS